MFHQIETPHPKHAFTNQKQFPWHSKFDYIKRIGAASHVAVVEGEIQGAQHGKGDGQEEEVHCHLAKRLGLKSEAVEPSGKGVFADTPELLRCA